MIKITNKVDGKKYELVPEKSPRQNACVGCAFCVNERKCLLSQTHRIWNKNISTVCGALHGIWKEVKDED